jgi:hypothetical protein
MVRTGGDSPKEDDLRVRLGDPSLFKPISAG